MHVERCSGGDVCDIHIWRVGRGWWQSSSSCSSGNWQHQCWRQECINWWWGRRAATCILNLKYSETMQCLVTYHHFLSSIPDMLESVLRNLWELEYFYFRFVWKMRWYDLRYVLQERIHFGTDFLTWTVTVGTCNVYLKAYVFDLFLAFH
jgi:hypothetical protein